MKELQEWLDSIPNYEKIFKYKGNIISVYYTFEQDVIYIIVDVKEKTQKDFSRVIHFTPLRQINAKNILEAVDKFILEGIKIFKRNYRLDTTRR